MSDDTTENRENMDFFDNDIITLTDEDGIEREFEALDYFEDDRGKFYALTPNFELEEEGFIPEETYFIFEIVNKDGEEELVEIEDETLLEEISEEFEKRLGII